MNPSILTVEDDSVRLVLWWFGTDVPLSLVINVDDIDRLTFKPTKWLHYVAWAILGLDGYISTQKDGLEAADETSFTSGTVYHYITPEGSTLTHAVDPEMVGRSRVTSTHQSRQTSFRNGLLERDVVSAITECRGCGVKAAHIIPFQCGTQHILNIVDSRPFYDDNEKVDDINSPKNGILLDAYLRTQFDAHAVVLLKLPNQILEMDDIPSGNGREAPQQGGECRYVFQWLDIDPANMRVYGENQAIDFQRGNGIDLPSTLLLDYVYGAAALHRWGQGALKDFNSSAADLRPLPLPQPKRSISRTFRDSTALDESLSKRSHTHFRTGAGIQEPGASDEHISFDDAMDFMYFLSLHTAAAHQRAQEADDQRKEQTARVAE